MRVLLDECLPRRLKVQLPEHEVSTVPEMGWAGWKDHEILSLAQSRFDAFVTVDQHLVSQQDLSHIDFAIIQLITRSNRLADLLPVVDPLKQALRSVSPGTVARIPSG